MAASSLRFAPEVLRRLGEELVPNPDQGILELAKNAYDADAVNCEITLQGTEQIGGTILVSDDGIGMDRSDVQDGWLVLGHSAKAEKVPTDRGRIPVGDKGLGRLAAMRLGEEVVLRTRPSGSPPKEFSVTIEWAKYDEAQTVESVPLQILETTTKEKPGTTLEIRKVRTIFGRREVQRLARSLLLLADPFDDKLGFRPTLRSPQFSDLQDRVKTAYFNEADLHLIAELHDDGTAMACVVDWADKPLWQAKHSDLSKGPYAAPAARFDLWNFLLNAKEFSTRTVTLGEVRDWLEVVGGVHLYHGGLRVHPYGDAGHDWLEMNLARARNPEFRPSTNNSIGKLEVKDPKSLLHQKTDRSGFVENDAFRELRRFAVDALDWMAKKRLQAGEKKREQRRTQPPKDVRVAQAELRRVIESAPPRLKTEIEKVVEHIDSARSKEAAALREDLELYRTLSTVGTTVAVFSHESAKPVTQIEKMSEELERRLKAEVPKKIDLFAKPLELIQRGARALRTFARLPIHLLSREKRRTGQVDAHATIKDLLALFEPFLADSKIELKLVLAKEPATLRGSVASLEAILANLLTNSINAFHSEHAKTSKRIVEVETTVAEDTVKLAVRDSGPGITGIDLEDIWLPGQSTTPGGTGLGLTIVRDSVSDLGGEVAALARGSLGGAEFTITLPLLR